MEKKNDCIKIYIVDYIFSIFDIINLKLIFLYKVYFKNKNKFIIFKLYIYLLVFDLFYKKNIFIMKFKFYYYLTLKILYL